MSDPATTKKLLASIFTDPTASAISKYTLNTTWTNPETEITLPVTFNINADVLIPKFNSKGAPEKMTLTVQWSDQLQFSGYDRFDGVIGEGRFYIKTGQGVKIKGEIEGGPEEGQSFVGAGTWTIA